MKARLAWFFIVGACAQAPMPESRLIVGGIFEAFSHSKQLLPGEATCLESNLTRGSADVTGVSRLLGNALKAIEIVARPPVQLGASSDAQVAVRKLGAPSDPALANVTESLAALLRVSTSLLSHCVRDEALQMLATSARECSNLRHGDNRLVLNDVDITQSLRDGAAAFEANHWHRFGASVGIAMRKVFLVSPTRGTRLPEGQPKEPIIQQVSQAFLNGFFISGRSDFHRCITMRRASSSWMELWSLIAELAVNGEQHGLQSSSSRSSRKPQPTWMGELMQALLQIPVALSKCSLSEEHQQMLHEAIRSIGHLEARLQQPDFMMLAEAAPHDMVRAIDAWAAWDFKSFGFEIGKLLRGFVIRVYPHAYSIDVNGRLQRQLSIGGMPTAVPAEAPKDKARSSLFTPAFIVFLVGSVAFALLVTRVALRAMGDQVCDVPPPEEDCAGSDIELARLIDVK